MSNEVDEFYDELYPNSSDDFESDDITDNTYDIPYPADSNDDNESFGDKTGNKSFNGGSKNMDEKKHSSGRFIGFIVFIVFILVFCASSLFSIIETGERGIVLRMGEFRYVMGEGLNFKTPFIDRVVRMSVRDMAYNSKLEVSSRDMQTIQVDSSLIFALDPEKLGVIYKTYGLRVVDVVIKPTLAEVVNSVVAAYPIETFVEKRAEISQKISQAFVLKTHDTGIIVKSFLITNHDFSDEYNKAIEAKKVAEQGALKAKFDLEKTRLDAEAQTLKQKSLNDLVIREKAIDKWDGKLPQYFSGNGELPFIMGK